MSTNVFANGREISGKASNNKSIAAFPDVCLSPPAPPAGPVPLPYPNTAFTKDTTGGTKTVKIGGKEVHMKGRSTYSKSTGDEPATQSFGANVVTHKLRGPLRFAAWSPDVMAEGANVTRFGDLTTHNHVNAAGGFAGTVNLGGVGVDKATESCEELSARNTNARTALSGDPRKSYKRAGTENSTITHATYTPPGTDTAISMRSCSRAAVAKFNGGFVQGTNYGKAGGTTSVCSQPYTHPPAGRPKSSHTEARILDHIMKGGSLNAGGKGKLLLAIDWKNGKPPDGPCPDCHRMICQAMECLDIKICSKKTGKAKSPTCEKTKTS